MINILKLSQENKKKPKVPKGTILASETSLNIRRILDTLPHRYPFALIDKVVEIVSDDELFALKNVTINEPFFQGHFPGNPVMPGVLQIEAMAQAAGVLLLRRGSSLNKLAYFMSCDKVKFRRAVIPGDQLEIHIKMTKCKETRGQLIGMASGTCKVDGKIVSSADLVFMVMDPIDE